MAESLEQIHELVRSAVRKRQPIAAMYHGYERKLCPHLLGWNLRGWPQALCYQYDGGSRRGLGPEGQNWRCIRVEELSNVRLLSEPWRTAENYCQPQTCVAAIEIAVEGWVALHKKDNAGAAEAGSEPS